MRVMLYDFKTFKKRMKKLRYDTNIKTITRKYHKGSNVWVIYYE